MGTEYRVVVVVSVPLTINAYSKLVDLIIQFPTFVGSSSHGKQFRWEHLGLLTRIGLQWFVLDASSPSLPSFIMANAAILRVCVCSHCETYVACCGWTRSVTKGGGGGEG